MDIILEKKANQDVNNVNGNKTKEVTKEVNKDNDNTNGKDTKELKEVERKGKHPSKKIAPKVTIGEHAVLVLVKKHNKESEDKEMIDLCLQKHFFLKVLEKNARTEIIKEMSLFSVEPNSILFEQGGSGNYFFIVKEGELTLTINDKLIKSFVKGDSFGELALLHNAPRSGTVKTKETGTKLWAMERRNFRKIIDHINNLNHKENNKYINTIPFLSNIKF